MQKYFGYLNKNKISEWIDLNKEGINSIPFNEFFPIYRSQSVKGAHSKVLKTFEAFKTDVQKRDFVNYVVNFDQSSSYVLKTEVLAEIFDYYLLMIKNSHEFQRHENEFEFNFVIASKSSNQETFIKKYISDLNIFTHNFILPDFDSETLNLSFSDNRIQLLLFSHPIFVKHYLLGDQRRLESDIKIFFHDETINFLKARLAFERLASLDTLKKNLPFSKKKKEFSLLQIAFVFRELKFYEKIQEQGIENPLGFIAKLVGCNESNYRQANAKYSKWDMKEPSLSNTEKDAIETIKSMIHK